MGAAMYLAMYWRANVRAKAAAEAGGMDIDMDMGRLRKALFSPPIDNGADAVVEAGGRAAARGAAAGGVTGGGRAGAWDSSARLLQGGIVAG